MMGTLSQNVTISYKYLTPEGISPYVLDYIGSTNGYRDKPEDLVEQFLLAMTGDKTSPWKQLAPEPNEDYEEVLFNLCWWDNPEANRVITLYYTGNEAKEYDIRPDIQRFCGEYRKRTVKFLEEHFKPALKSS